MKNVNIVEYGGTLYFGHHEDNNTILMMWKTGKYKTVKKQNNFVGRQFSLTTAQAVIKHGDFVQTMHKLFDQDYTIKKIANFYGLSETTVFLLIRTFNLTADWKKYSNLRKMPY